MEQSKSVDFRESSSFDYKFSELKMIALCDIKFPRFPDRIKSTLKTIAMIRWIYNLNPE